MARKKSHKENEDLLGEIRSLEKSNKELKRQIRQLQRQLEKDSSVEEDNEIPELPIGKQDLCNSCGKGKVTVFEIMNMIFTTCQLCGERKKIK